MTRLTRLFLLLPLLTAGALRAQSDLFIITSDFATGSAAYLPATATQAQIDVIGLHADAVGHYQDGRIYVINRFGQDNILVLDPTDVGTPVAQFSVGNGSNPQDIEILAADKAYVTRYESTELLIVDPRDGTELGTIDLGVFADADGLPEMKDIVRIGDRVYVSCQRLDRNGGWGPAGTSYLAVIDVASDQLVDIDPAAEGVQGIALSAGNPGRVVVAGTRLILSEVAGFGDRAGGIDIVDIATNRSLGLRIGEEALEGDIQDLVMVDAHRGFAVISDANFVNSVRPVDLSSATVGAPLTGLSGGYIATIAVDGPRLLVGDQGSFSNPAAAGLMIFDSATGAPLAGPIVTGLPPTSIVVIGDAAPITAVTGEKDTPRPQRSQLARAYPNPFNATVIIPFTLASGATGVDVAIFDLLGRRVRTLATGALRAGGQDLRWDGRNDQGQAAGSGTYLIRLRTDQGTAQTKIMLLK